LALLAAMRSNAEDLAKILTAENGKPFAEGKTEIAYGAGFLEWFAAEAVRYVAWEQGPKTNNQVIRPYGSLGCQGVAQHHH
jgi:acyl-CoA reductase-like NAD-dependent aldehyde dehydrogenase